MVAVPAITTVSVTNRVVCRAGWVHGVVSATVSESGRCRRRKPETCPRGRASRTVPAADETRQAEDPLRLSRIPTVPRRVRRSRRSAPPVGPAPELDRPAPASTRSILPPKPPHRRNGGTGTRHSGRRAVRIPSRIRDIAGESAEFPCSPVCRRSCGLPSPVSVRSSRPRVVVPAMIGVHRRPTYDVTTSAEQPREYLFSVGKPVRDHSAQLELR